MPTQDFAGPAWRDFGEVHVVTDLDAAYALADEFAFEHVQVLTGRAAGGPDQDAQLRRTVPRRGHLRQLRRQGDRHEPRAADARGAARYTGGLWVGKYLRTVTYQEVVDTDSSARSSARSAAGPRGSSSSRATPARVTCGSPSTAASRCPGRRSRISRACEALQAGRAPRPSRIAWPVAFLDKRRRRGDHRSHAVDRRRLHDSLNVGECMSEWPIAVIGAGYMGGGIAQSFALAGHRVALADADADRASAAVERLLEQLAAYAAAGLVDPARADAAVGLADPGGLPWQRPSPTRSTSRKRCPSSSS